ncbi:hypothetical protein ACSFA8_19990 [Variovorax sp. RT4R15]|uniref:hypothetical protein n=1 Tax=Variovorax sp. RT4R15 TaxID=3443737 RepID=UPI003F45E599
MEHRLWHASYPEGLPHDIALDESETLVTMLERVFARHAARTAVTCAGETLIFAKVEHASALLAPYKVPRHITFVDALSKSAVGKILRKELRPQSVAVG